MTFKIVVEGNIGSGKTTFIERLSKELLDMAEVLKEPVSMFSGLFACYTKCFLWMVTHWSKI